MKRRGSSLGGLALWLACGACAPVVEGGYAVAPEAIVPGDVVECYDPKPCRDASGASFDWRSRLFVVRGSDGAQRLVEARSQYDKLVFSASFPDGGERVFQTALRSRGEPARLHEVRIPVSGSGGGSYQVSLLRAGSGRGEKFRGEAGQVVVTCQLERVSRPESVDKASAASKLPHHDHQFFPGQGAGLLRRFRWALRRRNARASA